jgi:hypothetical protein
MNSIHDHILVYPYHLSNYYTWYKTNYYIFRNNYGNFDMVCQNIFGVVMKGCPPAIICDILFLAIYIEYVNDRDTIRSIYTSATQSGQLDTLRFVHEHDCLSKWPAMICDYAASCGHIDCLRYAHQNGCHWDEHTCSVAAARGHLDCLRYAHENSCPWDKNTCMWAAQHGHLDCLRYAIENGCPQPFSYSNVDPTCREYLDQQCTYSIM